MTLDCIKERRTTIFQHALVTGRYNFASEILIAGFVQFDRLVMDDFKFKPESVGILRLLRFFGFNFPENFKLQCRPSIARYEIQFMEFCSWLDSFDKVMSLQELSRLCLRKKCKKQLPLMLGELPNKLKNFVKFK